ncbi:hypothetical protein FACS1894196_3410 [Clostridia bacterium]|nr:hypothetical protein FACS1894196_3410 [Clostridia bacterium]
MGRGVRKKASFRFYVLLAVLVGLLAYGGYLALDRVVRRTAIIEADTSRVQYAADAVIARSEVLTDVEGLSKINYYADEGAMVYRGNRIAAVYTTGYSKTNENKLLDIRAKIKNYLKSLLASAYADQALERLDQQISAYTHELELLVHGEARGNLLSLERQLRTKLAERQTYLKTKYASDPNLLTFYDTENGLVKKIENSMNVYLADTDCLVSFYTDGYESTLDVGNLNSITAAQVRGILAREAPALSVAQRGRTAVFRQVRPTGWYLLLISHDPSWNPVEGQTYKVRLAGYEMAFDAVVVNAPRSGNDLLVRMTVEGDVRPVLNLRTARAEVGEMYVSGLRVPLTALYQQGGQTGVVLTDNGGIFVPVQVLSRDNTYAVVQAIAAEALREGQKIKLF